MYADLDDFSRLRVAIIFQLIAKKPEKLLDEVTAEQLAVLTNWLGLSRTVWHKTTIIPEILHRLAVQCEESWDVQWLYRTCCHVEFTLDRKEQLALLEKLRNVTY